MATVVKSMAVEGIDGFVVEVEATTLKGAQQMISIIGLGDQAVKEAAERMQATIEFCGYEIPKDKVIISLAPGNRRKRGSHYDLAMTIALLENTNQIVVKNIDSYAYIGELSLNGNIRPCYGILPMVNSAKQHGIKSIIVPADNLDEAKSVSGIDVIGMSTLRDTIRFLEGKMSPNHSKMVAPKTEIENPVYSKITDTPDFADVKGQDELIDAVVLGAAGGHNILMIGEPGSGKTMIAERIPTILPTMTEKEALEVTKIHSISGLVEPGQGLMKWRPFRAPHHNVSLNALVGGGSYAQPGEVSLSHNGVLFLDELAEFSKSTLDALRQPLQDKKVTISRVNGTNTYPANFMFVTAMNPCPCGYYMTQKCRCTDYEIMHYRNKISGPILERIDIQKWVKSVGYFDLEEAHQYRNSESLRCIVENARKIQEERFRDYPDVNCNAQMTTSLIQKFCKLDEESTNVLKEASERFGYSARVIHKLLKMARTAADIRGCENIEKEDIVYVLGCRDLDQSNSKLYTIG
ncbi:MAG: YifB family Mg chelatase-like AAA ATPase [Lachnospiraceae bacterium]|nr:YifB family Mg chelatase-like AAA ATPase [Lachnospiraceae bacterium]